MKPCGRYYIDGRLRCYLQQGHAGQHQSPSGAMWPDESCIRTWRHKLVAAARVGWDILTCSVPKEAKK